MAKNEVTVVTWHLSNDGLQPSPTPYGFIARNPVARVVPPGASLQISLQLQASLPMIAFPVSSHADDLTVAQLIAPGQDVVVTIQNKSQHTSLVVDDKEGLVNLCPVSFNGSAVVA